MAEDTMWNLEQVRDKRFKMMNYRQLVKRRLVRDTVWINREMARSNNRLVPDPDRYKVTESSAWSWPFLIYPMRMGAWRDDAVKFYEIGNPILWWASALCCLIIYPAQILYLLMCHQRGNTTWAPGETRQFWDVTKLLWGGYMVHYIPFFFMGRVVYIHHNMTALYFGLLLLAYEIQCMVRWHMSARAEWPTAIAIMAVTAYVFYLFSPLTFGWDRPIKELAYLQWLPTWNLISDPNLF
ncbi:Protein O-mannosyltransferase 2 [Coemansia sp. RSA 2618]|nr:Protein O-mannosyltransferase 2 [Coemansia sp. RSA 2618]